MNIQRAKQEIEHTVKAYLAKDALVRDELEFVLGGKDADLIYKHLNREAYAEDVLKQYGAELTPYGMVNRADFGPLHEPIPEQQQEQTQEPQMGM